jgi:acyl-CoA reductase-like NAD-dependent aldehyde dehydrogenase
MIIGGRKVDSSDGKTIDIINPTTHEILDTVPSATKADVETVIVNAQKGFEEWSAVPLWKRIDILKACRNVFYERGAEFYDLLVNDLGLPITHAREELNIALAKADADIEGARFLGGETMAPGNTASANGDLIITVRDPIGVVLAIIPFNAPLLTTCTKIWPALLMGNSVIIKPPTDDPLVSIHCVEIMHECGVPGNALQIITGHGSTMGTWLTADERVGAISITGSSSIGADVAANAGKNLSLVTLELGGNDPLIILPDADMDWTIKECVNNRLRRAGQICCASKRYIVHRSIKEEFCMRLVVDLKTKKIGNPAETDTDVGPVVSEKAAINVEKQINLTVEQGAKVLLGGKRINKTFVLPTVLDAPNTTDAAHDLEIFGPVWTVLTYDTLEEAIALANDTKYGLCSGVIGKDMKDMLKVAKAMQAGTCVINGSGNYVRPYSPFGGYKKSGLGRQSAMDNLKEFSQVKTIVFRQAY